MKVILVSAVALIDIDGRVLLAQRPEGKSMAGLWEFPGGKVESGETPEAAARREAVEAAHLTLAHLAPVGECYASPGAATDFFHLFVGLCDLPDDAARIGGAVDEGENIRSHLMAFDDLLAMAEDRRTANTPLTLLVYWLAYHRGRLAVG